MKSLSSWLVLLFMGMFWIFRFIVALSTQNGGDLGGFISFNYTMEIILLFVTLVSIILIVRRSLIGGILYLGTYGYYFGGYLLKNILPSLMQGQSLETTMIQNALVCVIAIIIAIYAFFDILITKIKRNRFTDSKTDWFFNNKETDRQLDEKADKNQYKIY